MKTHDSWHQDFYNNTKEQVESYQVKLEKNTTYKKTQVEVVLRCSDDHTLDTCWIVEGAQSLFTQSIILYHIHISTRL